MTHRTLEARLTRLCALALAFAGPAAGVAQSPSDPAVARARADALQALQGAIEARALDPREIEATARGLLAIREAVPDLDDIRPYADRSYLVVTLTEEASARVAVPPADAADQPVTRWILERVGVESLDSLNAALGVDSVEAVHFFGGLRYLRPYFPFQPNVPVLAPLYEELPGVELAGVDHWQNFAPSRGDRIAHFRKGGSWQFVFVRARGDCPAGCTEHDYYYVTWDPERERVELLDVFSHDEARPERVHLWGIPRSYTMAPFEEHRDLLARMEHPDWWVRRHATGMTGRLLRQEELVWRVARAEDGMRLRSSDPSGIPEPPRAASGRRESLKRLERLEHDVGAHRLVVTLALVERIMDEDPWVREGARVALSRLSGIDHGEGEAARERWRAWARAGGWRAPPPFFVEEDTCEGELCAKIDGVRLLERAAVHAEPSLEAPIAFHLEADAEADVLTGRCPPTPGARPIGAGSWTCRPIPTRGTAFAPPTAGRGG